MFHEFSHRHSDCFVDGLPDKVILSRESRSSATYRLESMYNGVFAASSQVNAGSLVTNGETFLVLSMRLTVEKDKYCQMVKTNAMVDIARWYEVLDENDNQIESGFDDVETGVPAYVRYVDGDLRQQDLGLLPSTEYVLIMQKSVDIKRPTQVSSPDRVKLNGRNYQVDAIDDLKYPNLLYVQVSEDRR